MHNILFGKKLKKKKYDQRSVVDFRHTGVATLHAKKKQQTNAFAYTFEPKKWGALMVLGVRVRNVCGEAMF